MRQSGGKTVTVFARSGNFDATQAVSNTFEMEWPRGSGRTQTFPEVDRAGWFVPADRQGKVGQGQIAFVDRLVARLVETH